MKLKTPEDILSGFTDTELAYLSRYQLETYLKPTQERIKNYIFIQRKLNPELIEKLIADNASKKVLDSLEYCPRCKSDKVRVFKVDWAIPLFESGAEDELAMYYELHTGKTYLKDKIVCNVCGYVLDDPNARKSFLKKIRDILFDNPVWLLFKKQN